jgi:hypothetical protein
MSDEPSGERPVAITVVCVLGFIAGVFIIPLIFSHAVRNIGAWYPPYLAFSAAVGFVCLTGFWNMVKWSVYLYAGFLVFNQVVLIAMGVWNIFGLLIPAIVAGVGFIYLSEMK